MSDLISRQAAIDSIEKHLRFGDEFYPLTNTDKVLNHAFEIAVSCVYNLPSAQPVDKDINVPTNDIISRQAAIDAIKALPDCPNGFSDTYDKAWIISVLEEVPKKPTGWNPVKTRPMDEEEREHFIEYLGWHLDEDEAVMFESLMPGDGQEVWVCSKCGNVWQDTCVVDEGIGLEGNGDWNDIVAWMPFERPEPYKEEE